MKKYLENVIARKQAAITDMKNRVKASADIDEVRSLGDQIEAAQQEIEEARAKLAECNTRLGNTRAEMDDGEQDGEGEEEEPLDDNARSRNFHPGRTVGSFNTRGTVPQQAEARANEFAKTGRQSIPVTETRATLISGGNIATPTEVGGINDAFTQVSSIVDMVKVTDCSGMGAYKVAYEITAQTAAEQTEGAAITATDPSFGVVTITPETVAVLSYVSKQVRKQSPLLYDQKVRSQALVALRRYAADFIITQAIASELTKDITLTAINEKTLRTIALNYGGALGVEGSAVLYLNKATLLALGDVRGTQEKKAVYEITPDASNPNTGIIQDGGLSVKYCLEDHLNDNALLYGNPKCFELGLFGNYEIATSEDFAFDKLMLAIRGDAELGGTVVVKDGLIYATVGA